MGKALTRIKRGKGDFINVGDEVPEDLAKKMPWAVEGKPKQSVIDPSDNASHAGAEAAEESILMRPDNANRPAYVRGEDEFKIARVGALGNPRAGKKAETFASGSEQHEENRAADDPPVDPEQEDTLDPDSPAAAHHVATTRDTVTGEGVADEARGTSAGGTGVRGETPVRQAQTTTPPAPGQGRPPAPQPPAARATGARQTSKAPDAKDGE